MRKKYDLGESFDCCLKLLLFKRLSDQLYKEKGTQLSISEELCWSFIERKRHDIAKELNQVLTLIEINNPKIKGVFTYSEINFWNRFDDETLGDVIRLISELDLSDKNFNDLNELVKAYEDFNEQRVSIGSDKKRIYAPRQLIKMIIKMMLEPSNLQQEISIYDPVCGLGEFLIESANFIKERGGHFSQLELSGWDEDIKMYATKANLIFHGIYDFDIRVGNPIFESYSYKEDKPKLFDIVLANPPFTFKVPCQINRSGIGSHLLFIQHIISSLKDKGKAAVILPRGFLFREGDEEKIRQNIIKNDLIEAVIEIAPKLFYHASIPVVILIFNCNKSNKNKILFIDASREYKARRGKNFLETEHINHIVSTYHNFKDEEEFARLVPVEEVANNKYNLSVDSYIIHCVNKKIDIDFEISKLHQLETERFEIENKIDHYLRALGIDV